MELETLNKLYLELSQFATAKTKKEIELELRINDLENATDFLRKLIYQVAEQQAIPDNFCWEAELDQIWSWLYNNYPNPF